MEDVSREIFMNEVEIETNLMGKKISICKPKKVLS